MNDEGYPDRILSKNERESLETLLRSQNLKYPNYDKWVSETITQIDSGEKIAFGLFTSAQEIAGDGIIRITASKTVELKNFFIQENYRKQGNGRLLLEYIENYCIENWCTQIHVDMPIDDCPTIIFFIKNGYEFQARGDFYGRGEESYLLVKKLQIKYIGEYDWVKISDWVMNKIFRYNIVNKIDEKCSYYSKSNNSIELMATVCICDNLDIEIGIENLQDLLKPLNIRGNLFCFASRFSSELIQYAEENGITLVDHDKLEKLSGFTLPTSSKDIAGLIVVIKPEYYEKLVNNEDRVFIQGKGVPNGVEENQVLLFYVTSPTQAIGGFTQIRKITEDKPSDIWKKYSRQSAFADEEYYAYTEGKSIATAYSFEKINQFSNEINLDSIRYIIGSFSHQAGQRISTEEWKLLKDFSEQGSIEE